MSKNDFITSLSIDQRKHFQVYLKKARDSAFCDALAAVSGQCQKWNSSPISDSAKTIGILAFGDTTVSIIDAMKKDVSV